MKPTHHHGVATLAVILLIAFLARLPLLNGSFWLDEAAQALEVARPLSQQFNIVEDFQPPLLHLILHAAQHVSHREWFLRLIGALIPGLMTVYATYQIGTTLRGNRVGSLAALFLATSSYHIFFSQELRPYALPAMIASLSWWRILRWQADSSRWFDPIYCALSFAGLFSTYLYPLLIASQLLYVAGAESKLRKKLLGSLAVAGVGFMPWLPFLLGQFKQGSVVQSVLPGWASIVAMPQVKSLPLVAAKFLFGAVNIEPSAYFIVAGLIVLASGAVATRDLTKKTIASARPLIFWLVVPILSAWLISFVVPVLQPKRVLFSLPAFYLCLAILIDQGWRRVGRLGAWALLATLLSINLYSTYSYYRLPELQRENWRALHAQIIRQYPKDSSVAVFAFSEPFAPWRWYDDGSYPTVSLGMLGRTDQEKTARMLRPVLNERYRYVLVFDYLRDLTDPENLIPTYLQETGYVERDTIDYPNIGFVRVFSRKEAATAYDYRH